MPRIALITPPSQFLLDERVFMSLGILKVAAALEKTGYVVDHLDLSGVENYEDVVRSYNGSNTFGITATTAQMPAAIRIAKLLHAKPGIKVILGGPHGTLTHAAAKKGSERAQLAQTQLLQHFDAIVCGDGESAVFQAIHGKGIIDADDPKSPLWLTSKGFDESPWPARHLVDTDSYHYSVDGKRAMTIINQLGCPFRCSFCGGRNSPSLRQIRLRTSENVVAEMVQLNKTYGVEALMCFDEATEVLTQHGWKRFRLLEGDDMVATLDPLDNQLRFEKPSRYIRYRFTGKLVCVKTRSIDLAVTPDHSMWMRKANESWYERVPARELLVPTDVFYMSQDAEWHGTDHQTFSIPRYDSVFLGRKRGSPKLLNGTREFPATAWVRFMAWYLSEGSCYRPRVRNGRGYRICIRQSGTANPEKVTEIREVLTTLGYRFSFSNDQFHIDSKELYEYLKQFGTSHFKHVPPDFKLMSKRLIRLFIDTYIKGDGSIGSTGQSMIMSVSSRMRDDLQELIIKGGAWAYNDNKYRRVTLSQAKETPANSIWGPGGHITEQPYDGDVHCVTVSTGVILVRRNGKAVWSGNCFDDELNVNKQVVDLMRKIAATGIDWRLRGFVKANLFTEEQAEAMYAAGFRWLLCGFESAHPRILKNIQKMATVEQNTNVIRIAHKYGLKVKALMSFGHPAESEETILATRDWLIQERPDDFDCTVITCYPGTGYYDDAKHVEGNVYRYEIFGDALYQESINFLEDSAYYKGASGAYRSYVWTDFISPERMVELRDQVEDEVRRALGLSYPSSVAALRFESSMGQTGFPRTILRSTEAANVASL